VPSVSRFCFCLTAFAQDFDTVIANGRIVDGSGNPWYGADVGIRGDRIVSIGDLSGKQATQIADTNGLIVPPSFMDAKTRL
jgi:N-acyl-D-amino-acid deacylase